jgi:hypothetical protein
MHRPQQLLFALTFTAMTAVSSSVWAAGFENIIVSTEKDADTTQDSFAPDTPKIFVSAELTEDVPAGSTVNIVWISVDSALTKPNSGWPVGTYKIEFSVDGKPMESVGFAVK